MLKLIKLPDENAISPEMIRTVTYIPGKGVMCLSADSKPLCYIKTTDPVKGKHIRDELIKVAIEGCDTQPDWSSMEEVA